MHFFGIVIGTPKNKLLVLYVAYLKWSDTARNGRILFLKLSVNHMNKFPYGFKKYEGEILTFEIRVISQ